MFFLGILSSNLGQESLDSTNLVSFMDILVPAKMKSHHVKGLTISVVKDSSVLWSKGYGYADYELDRKVDKEKTLFQIGSISKLFVWTAVMQLVEEGKIDLKEDIRSYIKGFTIPDNYEEVITMEHLMSHTPGFEDYYFELFSYDSIPPESVAAELAIHMPERVRPPGMHPSYSNHGTAIASSIVESVSGMSWDEYVEQHIIDKLGMVNFSFRYQVPENMEDDFSNGYLFSGGEYYQKPVVNIPFSAVGGAYSSAEGITPFMLAFLNHGSYQENRILDSTSVDKMFTTLYQGGKELRGMKHGFFDLSRNGYEIVGHGGATEFFFSSMKLVKDEKVGIFISANTSTGREIISDITDGFIDRYFPGDDVEPASIQLADSILQRYDGRYIANRRPFNRFTKSVVLLDSRLDVSVDNGRLKTSGIESEFWYPINRNTFKNSENGDLMRLDSIRNNKAMYLHRDRSPHVVYERQKWYESTFLNAVFFISFLLLGIFSFCYWLAAFYARRKYKSRTLDKLPRISKIVAITAWVCVFLFALFALTLMSSNEFVFRERIPTDYVIFTIPIIGAICILIQMIMALWHLGKKIKLRAKVFYLIYSLIALIVGIQLYFWGFLGYQF